MYLLSGKIVISGENGPSEEFYPGQALVGKCQDIVYRNKCQDIVDSLSGLRLCCLLWDVVSTQLVFKFIHLTLLME